MKATKRHFNVFKKECLKWDNALQLSGWRIEFAFEEPNSPNARAELSMDISNMCAQVCLNPELIPPITDEKLIQAAKHEMIHLLIGRLTINGRARYISIEEVRESEEELVRKLCKLIPDIK